MKALKEYFHIFQANGYRLHSLHVSLYLVWGHKLKTPLFKRANCWITNPLLKILCMFWAHSIKSIKCRRNRRRFDQKTLMCPFNATLHVLLKWSRSRMARFNRTIYIISATRIHLPLLLPLLLGSSRVLWLQKSLDALCVPGKKKRAVWNIDWLKGRRSDCWWPALW